MIINCLKNTLVFSLEGEDLNNMNYTLKNTHTFTEGQCGAAYQTYCRINGQTVEDNITFTYDNNVIAQQTYNLADVWNEIQEAIKVVHNLGANGTKKPNIDGLTEQQKNTYTTLSYYNDLLTRLEKTNKTGLQYIKALDIADLKKFINEYELSSDLCQLCNNSCQYCNGCETYDPCPDYCDHSGGGGGCDDACCMVGHWGCVALCEYY